MSSCWRCRPAVENRHQSRRTGVGRELGSIIATDVPRRRPAPGDDPVERGGRGVGGDAPGGHDRQRLPCVLVDDVEQLQDPPVRGLVELEVQRPDVVRPLSPQPHGGHGRVPQTLTLASLHRDAQPFLTPEPLHPLAIHAPALLAQPAGYPRVRGAGRPRPAVPPAGVATREGVQRGPAARRRRGRAPAGGATWSGAGR